MRLRVKNKLGFMQPPYFYTSWSPPSATAYDIFSVECCAQLLLNFQHVLEFNLVTECDIERQQI